jgi:hypothetical protein
VTIFDRHRQHLQSFALEEIYRWGYKPSLLFYFEVKISEGSDLTVEFDTEEGQVISDLLTDYAMAYMKEKEFEATRNEEANNAAATAAAVASNESKSKSSQSSSASKVGPPPLPPSKTKQYTPKQLSSVVKIQAVIRGYVARTRVSKMIELMFENGELPLEES